MDRIIPLTKGYQAIIDDRHFERLSRYSYYAHVRTRADGSKCVYGKRDLKIDGKRYTLFLHHDVMQGRPIPGFEVDHEDGDGLNNRDTNLRVIPISDNRANQRKRTGVSSQYQGVHWDDSRQKWKAEIQKDGRLYYVGRFNTEIAAALAYDAKARELYGETAKVNFPA